MPSYSTKRRLNLVPLATYNPQTSRGVQPPAPRFPQDYQALDLSRAKFMSAQSWRNQPIMVNGFAKYTRQFPEVRHD